MKRKLDFEENGFIVDHGRYSCVYEFGGPPQFPRATKVYNP